MSKKQVEVNKHQYAYKYRLYPTESQKHFIEKHFGCSRFVYNWALGIKNDVYEESKVGVNKGELQKILSWHLKDEYPFLKEVDSLSLIHSLQNLDTAFKNFFRRVREGDEEVGYPQFKSKHVGSNSYQFHQGYKYHIDDNKDEGWISPPKFSKGSVKKGLVDEEKIKMITHRCPPKTAKGKTVTISKTPSGEYYASILFEWETKRKYRYKYDSTDKIIGIDLGIKDFLITSDGNKYNLDGSIYSVSEKYEKMERELSRKQGRNSNWKQSIRYEKLKKKKAKYERKIARIREQNHYDIIHDIIKQKPKAIAVETLKVKNMVKNRRLSKAISSQGWGMFIEKLKHKCDERGITLIKIDQWFPSSQLCSTCGEKNKKIKNLAVREWKCPSCGSNHDRDINSAKNIRKKAESMFVINN